MSENRCVCCGEIIPEGMIACPNCLVVSKRETELKPCPFCGSNPVFGKPSETKTSLRCSNPQCYLWWNPPTSFHNGDTEEHARLRLKTWWNRRTEDGT